LLSGQIFSAFGRQEHAEIWSELHSIKGLIPSLFTFFENLKYLSACADCLKRLVKLSRGDTVAIALQRKFLHTNETDDQCVLEIAESTFVDKPGAAADPFNLGYRQLWLFAMRHYREMPAEAKKKGKDLLAKAEVKRVDEKVLSEFASLANRLGVQSNDIRVLMQQSSNRQIARTALLKARKPDRYQYDETILKDNVTQIVEFFRTAAPLPCDNSSPSLTSDDPGASGNRCGFSDEDAQQEDGKFLFLPHLHEESEEQGENVTSFFMRRSVYLAFFGPLENLGNDHIPVLPLVTHVSARPTGFSESQGSEMQGVESSERQSSGLEGTERQVGRAQERLEQERLEQERLGQERLEQERLKQERLGQERLEQERLEQERLEQVELEQERLEQARLEQERLEQERLEQERLEQVRLQEERLEQEGLEHVRLEQRRLEQVRLKQVRLEQARLEEERLE
jgi:Protein of unknown function (DUF3723)